jgi:hypothetical protein
MLRRLLPLLLLLAAGAVALLVAVLKRGEETRGEGARAEPPPGVEAEKGGVERAEERAGAALWFSLRVVERDGSPAAGAALVVETPLGERFEAFAAPDGSYRGDARAPGDYAVFARRGRAHGSLRFALETSGEVGTIELREGFLVRGTVRDARRKPVAGAAVTAVRQERRVALELQSVFRTMTEPNETLARARSAEDGSFALVVPAGTDVAIAATAPGLARDWMALGVVVADVDDVNLLLFPGAAVAGRVVDAASEPVPGALVMVLGPEEAFFSPAPKTEAVTDAGGAFRIAVAPRSDDLVLFVRAKGYATAVRSDLRPPVEDLLVRLERGATLRARVVDETSRAPVPDASVFVVFGQSFASGRADEDGFVTIPGLADSGAGGARQREAYVAARGYVGRQVSLEELPIVNGAIDAGDVSLARGGVVRGTVFEGNSSRVIAGASVRAIGGPGAEMALLGGSAAISDAKGRFEIRGVPLGATALFATHPEYVDPSLVNALTVFAGTAKPLFEGRQTEVERDVRLVRGSFVRGRVVDPDGRSVGGAEVALEQGMMEVFSHLLGMPVSATSAADGTFAIGPLRDNVPYSLVARHREFGPSARTTARAGGAEAILALQPPIEFAGTVVDARERPIEGVRVSVETKERASRESLVRVEGAHFGARPAVTDAEGRFTIANAPSGEVRVSFAHEEFVDATVDASIPAAAERYELRPVTLRDGLAVEGVVVDEEGRGVAGAFLWVTVGTEGATLDGESSSSDVSDEKGRFRVGGLAPGKATLHASAQGHVPASLAVTPGEAALRVVVERGVRVRGRVSHGGRGLAGAVVTASRDATGGDAAGGVAVAHTRGDGTFELGPVPRGGRFRLRVEHDEYRPLETAASAWEGEREFVLESGGTLEGIVAFADGMPVAAARVRITEPDGRTVHVATDATGRFRAGGFSRASVTVVLEDSGELGLVEQRIEEVALGTIRLVAERGVSIRGRILDADGEPVEMAHVVVRASDGSLVKSEMVFTASGEFHLRGLRPGPYSLQASAMNEKGAGTAAVVAPAEGIELRLSR